MKKVILFSALCLFFHYQAFSQVEFGIKAGVMAADVHEVNIQEHILRNMHAKARFSYLGGGFSDISINPRW